MIKMRMDSESAAGRRGGVPAPEKGESRGRRQTVRGLLGVSSAGAYSGLLIHVVRGHKEVKLLAVLLLFLLDMV